MNKIKLINGWTKEKVMAQVMKYNKGERALFFSEKHNVVQDTCVYEDKDGNRCAVGCFIPDGHVALKSRLTAPSLVEEYAALKPLMPFEGDGLTMFQKTHDKALNGDVYRAIDVFLDSEVE